VKIPNVQKYHTCKNGRLKIGDWVVGENHFPPHNTLAGQVFDLIPAYNISQPLVCAFDEQQWVELRCDLSYRFDTQEEALAFLLSR